MKLPPIPKWNETTDDIDYEDFCRRSLNFERSLLPSDIIFPQPDQIWETLRDCHVCFRTWSSVSCDRVWFPQKNVSAESEPIFFPFGKARLQRGEQVRITHVDNDWKPLQITFIPLRYEELLDSIVPEDQRKTLAHYELNLRSAPTLFRSPDEVGYFVELFKLIAEAAD